VEAHQDRGGHMHRAETDVTGPVAVAELGTEASLLKRFAEQRDEAAFSALVERYGPLVFGVCQRVLQHRQDAEDAFQATFLVLARKAGSIGKRECVGSWLYSVAYRIARQAKAKRARLPVNDINPPEIPAASNDSDIIWSDLRPFLDAEVSLLPARYREPFV